jgi:hypothetical protein
MHLATFNVESLFSRAAALNADTWAAGRSVLNDIDNLARRIAKPVYAPADKRVMVDILVRYQIGRRPTVPPLFEIIEAREKLFKIDTAGTLSIVATGRAARRSPGHEWTGLALRARTGGRTAARCSYARFTGRHKLAGGFIRPRLPLERFNRQMLGPLGASYPHDMCIDGNDPGGIDVNPAVNDRANVTRPLKRAPGEAVRLRPVHRASHASGVDSSPRVAGESAHKRERQARRVAELYRAARKRSDYVAVVGDLNDTPDSTSLAPLLQIPGVRDVSEHPLWTGPVGTRGTGRSKDSKIDYILLSPELWKRVTAVGAFRAGVYAPTTGEMWPGLTKVNAASDHAAVWVEVG